MPFLDMPHGHLFYESVGSGRPILLISGLGGVGSFWSQQVDHFSQTNQVITFDHRGTGQSQIKTQKHSVDLLAQDTMHLISALGLEDITVIGHSTGGAIAQTIATQDASKLRDVVLSATWAYGDAYFQSLFRLRSDILKKMGPDAYDLFGKLVRYPPWHFETRAETLAPEEERQAGDNETILGRIDALMEFDSRDQLSNIDLPTLVIGARDDAIVPPYLWRPLQEQIPNAKSCTLETGGHFIPQTMSQEFNVAVSSFIDSFQGKPSDVSLSGAAS